MSGYHTLVPLDSPSTPNERRRFGNWFSSVYRAINSVDGLPYALRRVENFRLVNQTAFQPIDVWSNIHHPGIVHVHEAFTTRAFNDNSLVVAYTYHPNAQTLYDMHFKNRNQQQQQYGSTSRFQPAQVQTLIPERTIWSYIVQIASAVKKVHDLGQAVRMIDISKILVTSQNRVRIGSCGIIDILMHETPQDMTILQQEDLHMFGRLVFALCTLNPSGASSGNFSKSLELMGRNYSADMKNVALYLISKSGPHRTIGQLFDIINSKVVAEMDDALIATDTLEHELRGELENARLVRLMTMFGFITERPEFARDPRWSETGDRYIIKLFRDYVFHQVDEHGNPVISMSHVLTCMNKLDAGADERVMLVARDEQSCLVVTYKEIKQCMESAFG
ncbi:kinase-like domain-containing protein [Schizophyllum commune]